MSIMLPKLASAINSKQIEPCDETEQVLSIILYQAAASTLKSSSLSTVESINLAKFISCVLILSLSESTCLFSDTLSL
ncbi:MAG: hypothetical protein QM500_00715 [Methylococcales bacterium]